MKYLFLIFCSSFIALALNAQTTYTEKLRKNEAEKGMVIINQSDEIDRIVNNVVPAKAIPSKDTKKAVEPKNTNSKTEETTHEEGEKAKNANHRSSKTSYTRGGRHKARGYRICIFMGGNSRADKTKAYQMGQTCKEHFGELSVYTSFISPRWVTHVGDFRTRQDAQKYVNLIRRAGFTYLVRIVPSAVNLRNRY